MASYAMILRLWYFLPARAGVNIVSERRGFENRRRKRDRLSIVDVDHSPVNHLRRLSRGFFVFIRSPRYLVSNRNSRNARSLDARLFT